MEKYLEAYFELKDEDKEMDESVRLEILRLTQKGAFLSQT